MNKSLRILPLILLFTSCANAPKEQTTSDTVTTNQSGLLDEAQIGSANEADKTKRLSFLTSTLKEKNAKLIEIGKELNKGNDSQENNLTSEILSNEILLLEAEKFGLEQGFNLPQTEL
ncbi:MAG: hypothetical protein K9K67_14040 [Bacteriovoracaceae bacterium]|nr:hypothetical protein [Bacteriovoracaceae bacterium]